MRLCVALLLATGLVSAQDLNVYLSLTPDQRAAITQHNRDLANWRGGKDLRSSTVRREIDEETARVPLDPDALGLRYAELEVIRREIADRARQTRAANVAVLTDLQKRKLRELEESPALAAYNADAEALYLLGPEPPRIPLGIPAPANIIRILDPLHAAFRRYLALTDSQMQTIQQRVQEFSHWRIGKQERTEQVLREITEETAKNPLSAAAIGIRHAELEVIQREIATREHQLTVENRALLTDRQKSKLNEMSAAVALQMDVAMARTLRLLPNACPSGVRIGISNDFAAMLAGYSGCDE